jgi:hypothetical protein
MWGTGCPSRWSCPPTGRGRALGVFLRLAWVNGQPGAVLYDAAGRVVGVVELDVADGMVQAIRAVANPDKLGHIGPASDLGATARERISCRSA